jgi:hypothetical protein
VSIQVLVLLLGIVLLLMLRVVLRLMLVSEMV